MDNTDVTDLDEFFYKIRLIRIIRVLCIGISAMLVFFTNMRIGGGWVT